MKTQSTTGIYWMAAAVSVVMASIIAISSWIQIRESAEDLRTYAGYFSDLNDLQSAYRRQEAAVDAYEQLGVARATPLAELFKKTMPGIKYDTREIPTQAVLPGWTLRRISVSFPKFDLNNLSKFLSEAESQSPPWRITECTMTALSNDGSLGHARVFLQALEKMD
jgi:hypothetical protein